MQVLQKFSEQKRSREKERYEKRQKPINGSCSQQFNKYFCKEKEKKKALFPAANIDGKARSYSICTPRKQNNTSI